jgi:methionine sulfoxide reductase heme-binding subunit
VNPIQAATQRTGKYALIMLVLALACTPVNTLFGWRQVLKVRRTLGLYAFLFAAAHFTIFIWIDYDFNWEFLKADILDKPYIFVGATALLILSALAFTSFRWWMKRMGKNWKLLHRLVYLAGVLVVIHYAWARKGDIFRLQGDILQPLLFGLLVMLLLVLRIPAVRRMVSGKRSALGLRRPVAASKRMEG